MEGSNPRRARGLEKGYDLPLSFGIRDSVSLWCGLWGLLRTFQTLDTWLPMSANQGVC